MKTVFVHPERCIGCKQCEIACTVEHSQTQNLFLAVFEQPAPKARIHAEPGLELNTAFPNKCRHCNPAPCQMACPTTAIYRPTGFSDIVMVNPKKCIACGMCAILCPFDVITYHASAEAPDRPMVAIKCDHCIQRQQQGFTPACVEACKVGALEFGEINELVKSARVRYTEQISSAIGHDGSEFIKLPATVESWRAWGAAVTRLNWSAGKEREI